MEPIVLLLLHFASHKTTAPIKLVNLYNEWLEWLGSTVINSVNSDWYIFLQNKPKRSDSIRFVNLLHYFFFIEKQFKSHGLITSLSNYTSVIHLFLRWISMWFELYSSLGGNKWDALEVNKVFTSTTKTIKGTLVRR